MPGTSSQPAAVMTNNGETATVTPMPEGQQSGGGVPLLVTASPFAGGKRKSRKISKKVLKMLKKMGPSKVAKMIKKGGDMQNTTTTSDEEAQGGRRRRSGRKTRRYSRRR